jgi:hypothetical protein
MMKRSYLLGLWTLLVACNPQGDASGQGTDVGRVSYYGFDVQRITGLLEQEIDDYGCPFEISRSKFDRAIVPLSGDQAYNARDVRAKVAFGAEVFYIDRFGVGKTPNGDTFAVDKAAFVGGLVSTGSCDHGTSAGGEKDRN